MLRLPHAALIAGVMAWAAPLAAEPGRPLVVDLTTFSPTPRAKPIGSFLEDVTPLKAGTYPIVSVADPAFIEGLSWRMPTQSGSQCEGAPDPLPRVLEAASAAYNQLNLEGALALVRDARDTLACQTERVDPNVLKSLIFLEGALHFYLEDGQASATFSELALLYPEAEPDGGFPPELQQSFRQATAQARQQPDITVVVPPEVAAYKPALDGLVLGDGVSATTIKSGRHLVQIVGPRGEVRGESFTVFPGVDEDLGSLGELLPARPQVIGATVRAQVSSGRLDASVSMGFSRLAEANGHPYLLFIVPDPDAPSQMRVLTLEPGKELMNGAPGDLSALPPMDTPADPSPTTPSTTGGVKPPRRYDPATVKKRPKAEPTALRAGLGAGVLVYDGAPFVSIEPRFDYTAGPVSFGASGIFGVGGGSEDGANKLPGLRLEVLHRFYVGRFAPHVGGSYQIVAARVVQSGGGEVLLIEGTPELQGGTEVALNNSGLRLSTRAGVAGSPGLFVVGDPAIESGARLSLSFTVGAAWTW